MSDWFVDKLGPQPKNPNALAGSSLPKANNADSLTPPARQAAPAPQAKAAPAPAPQRAAAPPPKAPEPEPPKKKKGWF